VYGDGGGWYFSALAQAWSAGHAPIGRRLLICTFPASHRDAARASHSRLPFPRPWVQFGSLRLWQHGISVNSSPVLNRSYSPAAAAYCTRMKVISSRVVVVSYSHGSIRVLIRREPRVDAVDGNLWYSVRDSTQTSVPVERRGLSGTQGHVLNNHKSTSDTSRPSIYTEHALAVLAVLAAWLPCHL
jgi:hypothetical protein